MADRNERYRRNDYRSGGEYDSRQEEQFEDGGFSQDYESGRQGRCRGGQMGEGGGFRPAEAFYYEETTIVPRRSRRYQGGGGQGYGDRGYDQGYGSRADAGFGRAAGSFGASRYDARNERGFQPFTSEHQAGGDFARGGRATGYSGGYDGGTYGDMAGGGYGTRSRHGDTGERGFLEKAGDEIASWFGDDDAARRRQQDHRGRGPGNYTRSDQRILEGACDNLTDDWAVDARNIQVTVKDAEITLDGTVDSREAKRRAEDCVESISGVKHVQNNLRVQDSEYDRRDAGVEV
jgi:osmotically-inducible protein OsmY